jgi:hypothetical protein
VGVTVQQSYCFKIVKTITPSACLEAGTSPFQGEEKSSVTFLLKSSSLQLDHHRHMIGWFVKVAGVGDYFVFV